ncbi:MAG: hypothetical protein HKN42_08805 [Granulosicoccus sp.]|nr:hypothetical protein [Granulosicoccus sp.]
MKQQLNTESVGRTVAGKPGLTHRRSLLGVALLVSSLAMISAQAGATERRVATERFTEYAPVIDVQPVYREVRLREPRQECWTEEQQVIVGYQDTVRRDRYPRRGRETHGPSGNAIVGGLIGGVIGNQLGRGHSSQSRAGATVAGAIIGGAIANEAGGEVSRHRRPQRSPRVESRPIYETRQVERCKRVVESRSERQLQHYNVTYRYKGRKFVTQLPRDPGNRIELQVSVSPARR